MMAWHRRVLIVAALAVLAAAAVGGTANAAPSAKASRLVAFSSCPALLDYAKAHANEAPKSGAIYGGVAGGMTSEADEFIRAVMADMLDAQSVIPAG